MVIFKEGQVYQFAAGSKMLMTMAEHHEAVMNLICGG
jgi:hypothetical protein